MKNTNMPRKHHYVPRVYLRNFLIPEEKGERVYVHDKERNHTYRSSIENIAAERDFYKIESDEEPLYWEHFYDKEVESKYPEIIKNINTACMMGSKNNIILNENLKTQLAYMICFQLLRTRKARDYQFDIGRVVAKNTIIEVKTTLKHKLNKEHLRYLHEFEFTEKLFKELMLPQINDEGRLKRFIQPLMERSWVIIYNSISEMKPFITSDHPVCFYNLETKKTSFGDNGLAVPTTIIYYPISSKIFIALYPKLFNIILLKDHQTLLKEYPTLLETLLKGVDGKMYAIKEEKFIDFVNQIQLEQCYRQIYSSRKNIV